MFLFYLELCLSWFEYMIKKKKRSAKEIKGINKLSNALKEKEIV